MKYIYHTEQMDRGRLPRRIKDGDLIVLGRDDFREDVGLTSVRGRRLWYHTLANLPTPPTDWEQIMEQQDEIRADMLAATTSGY